MKSSIVAALASAAICTSALAQEAALAPAAPAPTQSAPMGLAANTDVMLALNSAVSSKSHNVGDKVSMTVSQDVLAGGKIAIPHGTHAVGQITRVIHNGGFGKSGKVELTFRYIDMGGKEIPVEGSYFQEGEGNTVGTVGAVFAAGVIGGLVVKGHSATIPEGREFSAHTVEAMPLVQGAGGQLTLAGDYNPPRVSMQAETDKERKARLKREKKEGKTA